MAKGSLVLRVSDQNFESGASLEPDTLVVSAVVDGSDWIGF